MTRTRRMFVKTAAAGILFASVRPRSWASESSRIRSAKSGPWSAPDTWESGKVPHEGSVVEISAGHDIVYDIESTAPIRMVHILGALRFACDRNTRLDVGLIKVGGDSSEDGAVCAMSHAGGRRPVLQVGARHEPIPADHTAVIRLIPFDGFDRDSLPAIVCCAGRMDFHGAPMNRTWVKLGAPVRTGDRTITLHEPVTGWRPGDRVILVGTTRQKINVQHPELDTFKNSTRDLTETEEHLIRAVDGSRLQLQTAARFNHRCDGPYRAEVANLSRNVIVESAEPDGIRGHTMYHHGSAGSIGYAEFRKLGKLNTLGRYAVHFHLARASMRGSSVIGASIWDSDNRWITVHGTDYLVVRDCVGYNSIGHGYFLEDGTEVYNIFDRNLAVQGRTGKPLAGQVLPFDHNSGSGFWWANSLNTFTRNVAAECDVYGFRLDMQKTKTFDPVVSVPQPDGSRRRVDARTLPFIRFEDNEAHTQRNHAFNLGGLDISLGGGCGGVGPDPQHPFVIRNMRVWDSHWSFHPFSPSVVVDKYDVHDAAYGLWKPRFENHNYHRMHMENITQHVILDATGPQVPTNLPWEPVPKDAEYDSKNIGPLPRFDLEGNFPKPLSISDDLPPIVVATHVIKSKDGAVLVRGSASDAADIVLLQVNGRDVTDHRANFAEWEIAVPATATLNIVGKDSAGNISEQIVAVENV